MRRRCKGRVSGMMVGGSAKTTISCICLCEYAFKLSYDSTTIPQEPCLCGEDVRARVVE